MSELQKRITKVQRREISGGLGFGAARREAPRAMLLAIAAKDTATAKAAIEAGADIVIIDGLDAKAAAAVIKPLEKMCAGARLSALDEAGAKALHDSGCDFAISPLDSTASGAMDPEKMGQVVAPNDDISDTTLRALGPIGLDGLYIDRPIGAMTLGNQLELVRLASFASVPLLVTVLPGASMEELRVLRDSGTAVVVAPVGTTAAQVATLVEVLKAIPAPKKGSKGHDMAIVPSAAQRGGGEDEGDEDDDDGEE